MYFFDAVFIDGIIFIRLQSYYEDYRKLDE